jgi:hypothetical protein
LQAFRGALKRALERAVKAERNVMNEERRPTGDW